jgi:UDP-N-acetyl-D-glucosamine dehydrogenase
MKNFINEFSKKVKSKKIKISVVGLGYVGLPIAIAFARKNFKVLGLELDNDRLRNIKNKKSYISDVSTAQLKRVVESGKFVATSDFKNLKDIDVIIICVPTPLKRKYYPDISYIKGAVKSISKNIKKGALVILESTTYPGTSEEVIVPLLEESGFKHGQGFYLCFSPERIDPGNQAFPLEKIPKVVGGISREAATMAVLVYSQIIKKVVPVSSVKVAEITKLLENTFRLVNIGLIDEIAMMCHKMGVNIWEVINAAKTKPFGFMPFYPGPGVGGHCIPKDPLYLYWKAKSFGFKSKFIKLASDVINYMPSYVVERVGQALAQEGKNLKKSRILVMGVTYKKDIKDLRKSPALDIIEVLQKEGARVSYHDPLIPYLKMERINLESIDLKKGAIKNFDACIIATDHTAVNYKFLLSQAKLIFDARNVYNDIDDKRIKRL